MKVAIDCREIDDEASGIGQYTRLLVEGLSDKVDLIQFSKSKRKPGLLWHLWVAVECRIKGYYYHSPHSLLVPILLGKRSVLTLNDLGAIRHPEFYPVKVKLLYQILLKIALSRVSQIIVYSNFTKADLLDFVQLDPKKIHVVPLYVTAPLIEPHLTESPSVITISSPQPRKNLNNLLIAWSLYKKNGGKGDLKIVGRNGWGGVNLRENCKELGITDTVKILETVSELGKWQLLSESWVSVYPSLFEGFGLPILESMSMKVPVIAGNNSSLPEVMGDGGIVVDIKIPEEICEALEKVIGNSKLRQELSINAESQNKKFNKEKFISGTLKTYHAVNR